MAWNEVEAEFLSGYFVKDFIPHMAVEFFSSMAGE